MFVKNNVMSDIIQTIDHFLGKYRWYQRVFNNK